MKRLQNSKYLLRSAALTTLMLPLLSPSASATPGSFWALETITANGAPYPGDDDLSIVAQNIGGQQPHVLHIAFSHRYANGLVGVRYACRNLGTAGWKFSQDISTGYTFLAGPRITVLPDGRISIVFTAVDGTGFPDGTLTTYRTLQLVRTAPYQGCDNIGSFTDGSSWTLQAINTSTSGGTFVPSVAADKDWVAYLTVVNGQRVLFADQLGTAKRISLGYDWPQRHDIFAGQEVWATFGEAGFTFKKVSSFDTHEFIGSNGSTTEYSRLKQGTDGIWRAIFGSTYSQRDGLPSNGLNWTAKPFTLDKVNQRSGLVALEEDVHCDASGVIPYVYYGQSNGLKSVGRTRTSFYGNGTTYCSWAMPEIIDPVSVGEVDAVRLESGLPVVLYRDSTNKRLRIAIRQSQLFGNFP